MPFLLLEGVRFCDPIDAESAIGVYPARFHPVQAADAEEVHVNTAGRCTRNDGVSVIPLGALGP